MMGSIMQPCNGYFWTPVDLLMRLSKISRTSSAFGLQLSTPCWWYRSHRLVMAEDERIRRLLQPQKPTATEPAPGQLAPRQLQGHTRSHLRLRFLPYADRLRSVALSPCRSYVVPNRQCVSSVMSFGGSTSQPRLHRCPSCSSACSFSPCTLTPSYSLTP